MGNRTDGANADRDATADDPYVRLVSRCIRGDELAWEELISSFADLIVTTARRSGLSPTECEEAFQNTVVAIYEQLPKLRETRRLAGWIVGIASRQSINLVRSNIRERKAVDRVGTEAAGEPAALPDADTVRLERAQWVHEGLRAVSSRCRRLLEVLFLEDADRSYDQIAKQEKIPRGSIGPIRRRCLERLRKVMVERGWLETA